MFPFNFFIVYLTDWLFSTLSLFEIYEAFVLIRESDGFSHTPHVSIVFEWRNHKPNRIYLSIGTPVIANRTPYIFLYSTNPLADVVFMNKLASGERFTYATNEKTR